MIKKTINQTLILSGENAELYVYKTPRYLHTGKPPPPRTGKNNKSQSSLSRTRQRLFRLCSSNINYTDNCQPTFCTLTYKKNQTNRKEAVYQLKTYHQRLSYFHNKNIRYIAIPEYQKRGAIHYHIIYFNLPYTPVQTLSNKIWTHGNIDIHILSNIKNTSAYVAKYITKQALDKRHKGHRILITSRGLKQPLTFHNNDIDLILQTRHNTLITKIEDKEKILYVYNSKLHNS